MLIFLTHYKIDSFRVLRQSFCGKFEFSAEFSSKLSQFFGCMTSRYPNERNDPARKCSEPKMGFWSQPSVLELWSQTDKGPWSIFSPWIPGLVHLQRPFLFLVSLSSSKTPGMSIVSFSESRAVVRLHVAQTSFVVKTNFL